MIDKIENIIIDGSAKKPILIDVTYKPNNIPKQAVIFCHGFKGFKDWGPFNKIASCFAQNDIVFVKFNFSYNGTTVNNPTEFNDLKAFGNNNFSKELDDLDLVINWLKDYDKIKNDLDNSKISLFGHSRGGSISLLKTFEDNSIHKIVAWASPSNFLNRLPKSEKLEKWKNMGTAYIYNGRTKQNMPMFFQFYEDCQKNSKRLDIKNVTINLKIPFLVIHGSNDNTVLISDANDFKKWNDNVELHVIDGADHVLGGFHPFNLDLLPKILQEAVDKTISFLKA